MLDKIVLPTFTWEQEVKRVEQKIKKVTIQLSKDILAHVLDQIARSVSLLPGLDSHLHRSWRSSQQSQGGDETSVFTNLAAKSEGNAEEVHSLTCNSQETAEAVSCAARLPPYPSVSYKVTPGDTVLNLQCG